MLRVEDDNKLGYAPIYLVVHQDILVSEYVLVTRNFSYEEWSECLRMWVGGGLGIYLSLVLTLNATYNYRSSSPFLWLFTT